MRTYRFIAAVAALAAPAAGCLADTHRGDSPPPAPDEPVAEASSAASTCNCTPPGTTTCPGSGPNGYNPYKLAYFGDLHDHTSYSLDAYSFGTRTTPSTAYQFAEGNTPVYVGSATSDKPGPTITQPRPLDFLAITDHSEFLAVTHGCTIDPNSGYYNSSDCGLVQSTDAAKQDLVAAELGILTDNFCGTTGNPNSTPAECAAEVADAWEELICAAQCAYNPCAFTSLVAYEWTNVQGTNNDHHNVIFSSANVPPSPLNSLDYTDPPALWTGLDGACLASAGCSVVTIPHNSNESSGVSMQIWDTSQNGLRQQSQYQVSAEIYQHKGSSECNAAGWPNDPACGFENLDNSAPPASFVRNALEMGIGYAAANPGAPNPLQLGMVGATDDHNGGPGYTEEELYVGHLGRNDDQILKRLDMTQTWYQFGSGGITGAWAEQNTRAAIFAAIQRRETFATSGPRIQVRFYQTSDTGACADPSFPQKIIDEGAATAMGGTFEPSAIGANGVPTFAVQAWPDPWTKQNLASGGQGMAGISAVQIIKAHVSGSNPVTEDAPSPVSGIPATGGCAMWTDPTYVAGEHAMYYVRVLQVPTWRWSHNDCVALKASNPATWAALAPGCKSGGGLDVSVNERAWTSPIWFVPG